MLRYPPTSPPSPLSHKERGSQSALEAEATLFADALSYPGEGIGEGRKRSVRYRRFQNTLSR
jgi:hypothetical protein